MLSSVWQDVRYAWRGLRLTPGPFLVSVVALALGIGGTTAVFSVVDRILFRPLPYAAQDRLVWFGMKAPISQNEFLLEGDYNFIRQHQTVFEQVSSFSRVGECELNELEPMQLRCAQIASDFLPMLGIHGILGSQFQPSQDVPNSPRSALLTYGFWQRRFGGDQGVVGRTLIISGRGVQVAGVLPRDFELPNLAPVDLVWTQPLSQVPNASFTFLTVIGRLKPGVSVAAARAALEPLYAERLKLVPAGFAREVSFHVTGLRDRQVRDARAMSYLLLGCVAALLLIACANVANLLLARATAREREFAVRAALGASRWRLIRQTLTESLLVSITGGLAGLLLASVLLPLLIAVAPQGLMRLAEASLDIRVLAFTTLLSLGSGLLFGLAPALATPRSGVLMSRTGSGVRYAGQTIVATQIALSFLLLTGAGLLLRNLWAMQQVPLGMNVENVLVARVQLGQQAYGSAARQSVFLEAALEKLRNLPGTRQVAMSDSVPLNGPAVAMIYSNIEVQGGPPVDPKRQTGGMTVARLITPGYLEALGIPVIRGRGFREEDRRSGAELALIDERLARRLFPGQDPMGRVMRSGFTGPWRTIVGVTRAARNAGPPPQSDDPEYYFLWRQSPEGGRTRAHFLIRSEANPAELRALVRAEFAQLDPTLPVAITTMEQSVSRQLLRPRFETTLLGVFALIGVVLAGVGQYGLISCMVNQRSAETGIRMALGAERRDVVSGVVRRALAWTVAGSVVGLGGALWFSTLPQPLLHSFQSRDIGVLMSVLLLLLAVSVAAAWRPAVRAASIDPARTLRHD